MKIKSDTLVKIGLVIVTLALMVPAILFVRNNSISKANRLKMEAKEQYLNRDFVSAYQSYGQLIDSLALDEDAVYINHANAAYLSSELLGKALSNGQTQNAATDSSLAQVGAVARQEYAVLTSSPDEKIASVASNQLGYASIKGSDVFESQSGDSLLFMALEYFKNALRKDPANDSARYNYELVKKVIDFPETILSEAKALIAQKRYREAAALMEKGMRRDPRLRRQQDFMQRLRTVIAIDSLETQGS
jgi:tetratricopeptide (TPR) repeat protein